MVQSMTGYGSATYESEAFSVRVTATSLNHRFLEVHVRVPEALGAWEPALRRKVHERFERGRIALVVEFSLAASDLLVYEVNRPLVRAYLSALRQIQQEFALPGELTITALAHLRDLVVPRPLSEIVPQLGEKIAEVTDRALDALAEMRAAEGAHLRADLLRRLETIAECVQQIEQQAAAVPEIYRQKLLARMKEWAADLPLDSARLMQEVAHLVARADISEEVARLRSHLAQSRALLDAEGAVGKRLDFLFQEMSREINTILAKAGSIAIATPALVVKTEIEKLREQVHNVE